MAEMPPIPSPLRTLLLTASLAALAPRGVAAQPAPDAPPAGDAKKGDARELMQLGVKLLKSKDYLGALAVFKDAYQRFPSAKILLNVGTTLKLLGRDAEAVNAYQRYLDSSDADPARQTEVVSELLKLEEGLGRLEITAPDAAEVQIGVDEWAPAATVKLYRVAPGPFVVRARQPGFKPFELAGEVGVGKTATVTVALVAEPKPEVQKVFIRVPGATAVVVKPRSRLAATALGHFDVKGGGAGFVGASFDVTERIEATASAIIGSNPGGYVAGSYALLTGTLRPIVTIGLPVFFNSGARFAIRGAAGLELVANRHFALVLELGVEHNFNPQSMVEFGGTLRTIAATSFIPSLGVTARL
jgi:hypothetical protein